MAEEHPQQGPEAAGDTGGVLPPDYSTPTPGEKRPQKTPGRNILEFLIILAAAALFAYALQAFVVKPFQIPSGSMEPTLMPGDRVLVNRLAGKPQRGDIIVFRSPMDPNTDFIKRVIAVEGDTIEVRNGAVLVNNEPQVEDYVEHAGGEDFHFNRVPPGMLFVMGDNRVNSRDSRYWKDPWLPVDAVIGKAFFIYWPPSRLGVLH